MSYRLPDVVLPDALAEYAHVERDLRGTVAGQVWYVLEGATVVNGISAHIQVSVFEPDGTLNSGVWLCNGRSDGEGEALQSPAAPLLFNLGAGAAFTLPGRGPHAVFAARTAWVDVMEDTQGKTHKYLHWRNTCSDVISGLGDVNGEHTQVALKFRGVVLRLTADLVTLHDVIRDTAYQKSGRGAWFNPYAALQIEAGVRRLGGPLTDEFIVERDGLEFVAQGFVSGILAARLGQYDAASFFEVEWSR